MCLNVSVIGDIVVENDESIFVLFAPMDPRINFIGNSSALVNIIDDDGELNNNSIHYALRFFLLELTKGSV